MLVDFSVVHDNTLLPILFLFPDKGRRGDWRWSWVDISLGFFFKEEFLDIVFLLSVEWVYLTVDCFWCIRMQGNLHILYPARGELLGCFFIKYLPVSLVFFWKFFGYSLAQFPLPPMCHVLRNSSPPVVDDFSFLRPSSASSNHSQLNLSEQSVSLFEPYG